MSIFAQNVSYGTPDGTTPFNQLNFTLGKEKTGLVGPNGIGKSTLLDLILDVKKPHEGNLSSSYSILNLPQNFSQFYSKTVLEVLGIQEKLTALKTILAGNGQLRDYEILNDDWQLEERIQSVLNSAHLNYLKLDRQFETLSGGEMSRLLLAKIKLYQADYILLDEPTNHLDESSKALFYNMIENYQNGMLVVSHDRALLERMDQIMELSSIGVSFYGGNYSFYKKKKDAEEKKKAKMLQSSAMKLKKQLRLDKHKQQEQAKRMAQGKKNGIQENIGKSAANYYKNRSEQSASKLKHLHLNRITEGQQKVADLKNQVKSNNSIIIDINESDLPNGKCLLKWSM